MKISALIAAILLALSLTACGKKDEAPAADAAAPAAAPAADAAAPAAAPAADAAAPAAAPAAK